MTRWMLAEFGASGDMLEAARALRGAGVAALDGHTPYPVEGAEEALGLPPSPVPRVVLVAALTGAAAGYALQWWCNAVDYAIDVGGRPLHSPPANVPITFELGVLFAAVSAFVAVLGLSGLPRPWHPVFELEAFSSATVGRFWLSAPAPVEPDLQQRFRDLVVAARGTVHEVEVAP